MHEPLSFEVHLEHLPFQRAKPSLYVPRKSHARLWIPPVLKIVVTYRKLRVTLLHIALVNYANITTSKNWTLLRITRYRKLSQVQTEPLFHVK
jgi:hypothetical protein